MVHESVFHTVKQLKNDDLEKLVLKIIVGREVEVWHKGQLFSGKLENDGDDWQVLSKPTCIKFHSWDIYQTILMGEAEPKLRLLDVAKPSTWNYYEEPDKTILGEIERTPMPRRWTIKEVRDELPAVKVLFRGTVYKAKLSGRMLTFAYVHPYDENNNWVTGAMEVSWETIVHCLNNDRPIIGG